MSNRHSPVAVKWLIAFNEAGESSGCMRMYPVPPADQSVFKNVGRELSKRDRSGDVTR